MIVGLFALPIPIRSVKSIFLVTSAFLQSDTIILFLSCGRERGDSPMFGIFWENPTLEVVWLSGGWFFLNWPKALNSFPDVIVAGSVLERIIFIFHRSLGIYNYRGSQINLLIVSLLLSRMFLPNIVLASSIQIIGFFCYLFDLVSVLLKLDWIAFKYQKNAKRTASRWLLASRPQLQVGLFWSSLTREVDGGKQQIGTYTD